MHVIQRHLLPCFLFALLSLPLFAQEPGVVTGTVESLDGTPISGAVVELVDAGRTVISDSEGTFRFDAVAPGRLLLRATTVGAGRATRRVVLDPGAELEVTLTVELALHDEEIVVSAAADPRRELEVAQPVTVLVGEELDRSVQATIGETLNGQVGVSSSYFGPGSSRPVIRGQGGERIRTLRNGLGTADASATSPDHAVGVEPVSAERIEILRGPATLMYGSSAIGGVVNVLDGTIPRSRAAEPVSGSVELRAGTVADELAGGVALDGGVGRLAWHVEYAGRESDDYEIPGRAERFPEAEHDEGEDDHDEGEAAVGTLPNSSVESDNGSLGLSWIGDRGFLGVSVSGYETVYGVPGHGHGHEEEEHGEELEDDHEGGEGHEDGEEGVRIDLEQRRLDLRGELREPFPGFRGAKLRVGVSDYEHAELEGDEVGTRFANDGYEGRIELVQNSLGRLSGSIGLQASRSDFAAIGEEAFVPPSVTDSWALFAFEEIELGPTRLQLGGRFETQDVEPEGRRASRSFDGVSGSVGVVWDLAESVALTASLSRTERLPSANELYADGPHAATRTFEIGDPDLDSEIATGLDLSIKSERERTRGSVTLFGSRYDGYVFERFTGREAEGLDVVEFVQRDAEFYGAELEGSLRLAEFDRGDLHLDAMLDVVRAELEESGEPLPRIPPLRYGIGLSYHHTRWGASAEVRRAEAQDRVAPQETPTLGYTLVNASVSYRIFAAETVTDLVLRGTNLTDEEARPHTSFLKDEVPLPGRDLSLMVRFGF